MTSLKIKSWMLYLIPVVIYAMFSAYLVIVYNTTLILEFTRFAHDNSAHLYIPSTVINNGETSKFANLGTVWPFLYHLTLIPLVISNDLYKTGIAGAIINSLAISGSAYILTKFLKGDIGKIIAILFSINLYSLIHSSSSYMIPIGQFLAFLATLFSMEYIRTGSGRELAKASILFIFSSLARYETWPMVITLSLILIFKEMKRGRLWRIPSFIPLMFTGILWWILYNWAIFGNPFQFMVHPSPGAAGYYFLVLKKIIAPWTINFIALIKVLLNILGPLVVLLPFGIFKCLKEEHGIYSLLLLLSSSILLLAEGQYLLIHDHPLYYYFSFPFLYLLAGYGIEIVLQRISRRMFTSIAMIILIVSTGYNLYEISSLRQELENGYKGYLINQEISSEIVASWNHSGYILYSSIIGSYYFSAMNGIEPRFIFDEYDHPIYGEISKSPWTHNIRIVVIPSPKLYVEQKKYYQALCGEECYVIKYYEDPQWVEEFHSHYRPLFNTPINLYGNEVLVFVKR